MYLNKYLLGAFYMPKAGLVARGTKINRTRTQPCLQLSMELGERYDQKQLSWVRTAIWVQEKGKVWCPGYPRRVKGTSPTRGIPVQGQGQIPNDLARLAKKLWHVPWTSRATEGSEEGSGRSDAPLKYESSASLYLSVLSSSPSTRQQTGLKK